MRPPAVRGRGRGTAEASGRHTGTHEGGRGGDGGRERGAGEGEWEAGASCRGGAPPRHLGLRPGCYLQLLLPRTGQYRAKYAPGLCQITDVNKQGLLAEQPPSPSGLLWRLPLLSYSALYSTISIYLPIYSTTRMPCVDSIRGEISVHAHFP